MRCSKFFLILSLVLFCSLYCHAQDTDYVYKDSSIINADSIATKSLVVEMQKNDQSGKEFADDSLLKNSRIAVVNDSAEALKNTVDFAYTKNLDSLLKAAQKKEMAGAASARPKNSWIENFLFSPVTKILFWSMAVFFIGFILYKLFFTTGIFQRQGTKANVSLVTEKDDELSAGTDYNKLIAQAVINNNYRLATRYYYLQTLQKLAAAGIIQFSADKTNYQYITELFNKPYKNEFASLTLSYEYAWYGNFKIDERMFARIKNDFDAFNNQL